MATFPVAWRSADCFRQWTGVQGEMGKGLQWHSMVLVMEDGAAPSSMVRQNILDKYRLFDITLTDSLSQ